MKRPLAVRPTAIRPLALVRAHAHVRALIRALALVRARARVGALIRAFALVLVVVLGVAPVVAPTVAHAEIVDVSTPSDLAAAIAAARPGDEIVLADGTYAFSEDLSCSAVGTAEAPIVVRAANRHAAQIRFDTAEGFKVSGAYWRFDGLDIAGTCASDSDCEHAFHVTGAAHHFALLRSRVMDFNAQLKVNASKLGDVWVTPNDGLVEGNELGDTRGRNTSNPTTKLNIDTGERWIVRGNYLHDAHKLGGDNISYLAFMKSGGINGIFERNLVVCSRATTGGTRIGLSFGGGGTGAQYCAPAFDPAVPCSVEHTDGIIRNNIIANCSDVGVYLNRARNTRVLHNTIIGTAGIDFRFDTSSGEASGNVMTSAIRLRDGGTATMGTNMTGVSVATFASMYRTPLEGDLAVVGDVSGLVGAAPATAKVPDDYCATARPAGMIALGALEHSHPTCDTTFPPMPDDPGPGPGPGHDGGVGGGGGDGDGNGDGDGGCCSARTGDARASVLLFALVVLGLRRQRHRGGRRGRRGRRG